MVSLPAINYNQWIFDIMGMDMIFSNVTIHWQVTDDQRLSMITKYLMLIKRIVHCTVMDI